MRRILLLIVALTAMLATAHDALRVVVANKDNIEAGSEFDIDVALDNQLVYSALQTDLYLSPSLEFVQDEDGYVYSLSERAANSHTLAVYPQPNGAFRIIITTYNNRSFRGNSGTLFTIRVKARKSFGKNDHVALRNNVAVEEDASKHILDDVEFHLKTFGDVNGDGAVDVGDVNAVLGEILRQSGGNADGKYDINKDGMVDVGDVNTILSTILNPVIVPDTPSEALINVMYMEPVPSDNDHAIYRIDINGYVFENNGSKVISRYSGYPNTIGEFISVSPGDVNIKLYRGHNEDVPDPETGGATTKKNFVLTLYYEGTVTLASGDKGSVVIYDVENAPIFVPLGNIPTGDGAAVRLYNFIFDSEGVPTTKKVQLRLYDVLGDKQYHNVGRPIAFGEAMDWEMTYIDPSYSGGKSQRRDLDVVLVDDDGNEEPLTWVNSRGSQYGRFTDYWTLYQGRAYAWYLRGVRDNKNYPIAITQWTCR